MAALLLSATHSPGDATATATATGATAAASISEGSLLPTSGAMPAVATSPRYEIAATLDLAARKLRGRTVVRLVNPAATPLARVPLDLYPNRFRQDGDEVNDVTRGSTYPYLAFQPGGISVERVAALAQEGEAQATGAAGGSVQGTGATPLAFRLAGPPELPPETVLEVELATPLAPGGVATLEIDFTTRVPERYGPFGASEAGLVAVAGWYPYLATVGSDGAWQPGEPPEPARVSVQLAAPAEAMLVLGDQVFAPGHPAVVSAAADGVRTFAVIAYPLARLVHEEAGGTRFAFVSPEPRRAHRIGPEPEPDQVLRETVRAAVAARPAELVAPASLTVVTAPLRWNLTTPSDGPVVVSDRAMHVQALLRGFHEAQIAQAVYAEMLRAPVLACEDARERQWVVQAVAWDLADRFLRARNPEHRDVHQWIDWFDFFAIVDRFETAPKIPFVQSFFPNAQSEDDLRESVFTWGRRHAPARLTLARLDQRFGAETVAMAVDDYLEGLAPEPGTCTPFDVSLAEASDAPPAEVAAALGAATEVPPTGPEAIVDPGLRPEREQSRYQLILDTADVEVSSTEFGVAALLVARRRHDYTRDLAINPYVTERAFGVHAGPRLHFGPRNDAVTYRHNLFAFFDWAGLDSGFEDDRYPGQRDHGHVSGLGLRYDYSNVYFYDDPTEQREARLFADWYDRALGSDFGFVRFGARASATTPLVTPRTLAAIELLAGFEQPTADRGVPVQEQFSLGGRRALRGVSVNARLARNIGLARFELRQDVFPEADLDFLDLLTYRRPQIHVFLDTGQVDDSAGRALDPTRFALGAGIGVNALYEFLGFFPGRAYLEVATRLDRDQTDVQVLFGTRQAF